MKEIERNLLMITSGRVERENSTGRVDRISLLFINDSNRTLEHTMSSTGASAYQCFFVE